MTDKAQWYENFVTKFYEDLKICCPMESEPIDQRIIVVTILMCYQKIFMIYYNKMYATIGNCKMTK